MLREANREILRPVIADTTNGPLEEIRAGRVGRLRPVEAAGESEAQ